MPISYFGDNAYRDFGAFGRVAYIGVDGVGSVNVSSFPTYGFVYSFYGVFLGYNAGSTGTANISGPGTIVTGQNGAIGLNVGFRGNGNMLLANQSLVVALGYSYNNVQIGEYSGAVGTLTLQDGSQLRATGDNNAINVGRSGGTGTLNILGGSQVHTLGLNVARSGIGTVNVNGIGTHLYVSNDTGDYSSYTNQAAFASFGQVAGSRGNFNVINGGQVLVRNTIEEDSPAIRFAREVGSVGIGVVDGAGSQLFIIQTGANSPGYYGPSLIVGQQGDGTLTVRNNGNTAVVGDNATLFVSAAFDVNGLPPVAQLAQSELIIQSGGHVQVVDTGGGFDTINVGNEKFGNGAVRISGAGSKLISEGTNDEIIIGNRGTGLLTIATGGEVVGRRMFVGSDTGGVGNAQISGAGSKLTLASSAVYGAAYTAAGLWVGNRGNGTMTVSAAAHVDVTGARAFLSVGDGFNAIGPGSVGVLNIQSGGVVTVDHGTDPTAGFSTIEIGTRTLGVGTINVTGVGSKLISIGSGDEILVGDEGKGTLNVLASGQVQGQQMFVGTNDTATGTVVVDGAASKITLVGLDVFDPSIESAALYVGNRGDGTMTVRNGATVSLTGARAFLSVGDGYGLLAPAGSGLLTIQSGGKVLVNNTGAAPGEFGSIQIGNNQFGDGKVVVTGAGSTLSIAGWDPYIGVGNDGSGLLSVEAGGKVQSLFMNVGNNDGSHGTLDIKGIGSKVILSNDAHTTGGDGDTYAGFMSVGNNAGANGVMNITAGGVLEIRNSTNEVGPGLAIGNRQDSIGAVTVDGAGSAINIRQTGGAGPEYGPFIGVGNRGDGTLTVKNSAQINLTGEYGMFRVARGNNADDPLPPAEAPLSEAFILSGADVTLNMSGGTGYGARVIIAQNGNSNGILTINGTGSTLNILGNNISNTDSEKAQLIVASDGEGELVIANGADVFINGGDDKRPLLAIGLGTGSNGDLSITGVGSTLNLLTTNTAADGGGLITVSRLTGSKGALTISTGAQVINDLGSTNSAMTVGQAFGSIGEVIVDGNGNATTLLDAGQLLVVGAGWNESGAALSDVDFTGGGTGSVMVLDGATVRANNTGVGIGGTIGGNGKFDGNVTVDGGAVVIGASPGILTVTGALSVSNTSLTFEVNGLTAGTQYDQLKVTGAVTIVNVDINLNIDGTTFSFVDGNRILLIDGVAPLLVDINDVIVAPMLNEPATLAYSIADEGADLVFEALNNGLGLGTGLVSFGAASVLGATATINNGTGSGTGGRFNNVKFVNATGLEGTAGADSFSSIGAQAMTLLGLGGNDTLSSLTAADIMDGGAGADTVTYALSGAGVTVTLTGAVESIAAGGNAAGDRIKNIENIIGSGLADNLTGDGLANVIDGGGGADTMTGGLGNDTYVVDSLGDAITDAGGIELVRSSITYSIALAATLENLTLLAGFGNIDATGNALANILTGNEGDNTLNGGAGIDTMIGGLGNDTYVVDVAGDKVTELALGGTADTIETALATYSLAALPQVENLTYNGGPVAFTGTGNALANTIRGGGGNDTLNGGLGADILIGGVGNDTYTVDNAGDFVDETGGGALDHVQSSVSFDLSNIADALGDIERLTLTGALLINGTGSAIANTITGNAAANIIEGKGGGDTLNGGAGLDTVSFATSTLAVNVALNGALAATVSGGDAAGDTITNFENIIGSGLIDTLTGDGLANVINGGGGADIMAGGLGNDTYVVDNALDSVTDIGVGVDLVRASVTYSLVAAANVENLTLAAGAGNINATGSGIANILTGNEGNNRLDGGAGVDTMVGGLGNDTYVVDVATDKVTELAGGGTADTVETALATYSLAALLQVENLTFTGVGGFTGTGNALANTITGGVSGDNLNGGLGNDTLIGGAGADSFIFNSSIAATNTDTIDDFTLGEDFIKLENAIFTAVGAGSVAGTALSTDAFASNTDGLAADATDRIIYNSTNGWLNYDSNGSTAGGVIVHFATIDTGLSLTAADFLII